MKAIKCELCGSNDIMKQDGVYICQYCGTKYSAEEAKKMMVEGIVEVQGVVKLDNTSKQDNLRKLAQRAYKDKLYEEAYNYYNKMLENDADDWEAAYKKGICSAWRSTLATPRIEEAIKASKTAFNIVVQNEQNKDENFMEKLKIQVADDINSVTASFFLNAKNYYNEHWKLQTAAPEYWNRLNVCINAGEYIASLLSTNMVQKNMQAKSLYLTILQNTITYYCELCMIRRYMSGYNQYGETFLTTCYRNDLRQHIVEKYDTTVQEIKRYNETYTPPQITRVAKKGCYIATAVYGTYDCPEVWTLRRYRDTILDKTWYGKIFIRIYYKISPSIVKTFGKNSIFNKVCKSRLDKLVKNLQTKGLKGTPYQDKY